MTLVKEYKIIDKNGKVLQVIKSDNFKKLSINGNKEIEEIKRSDSVLILTSKCNQNCIFCSRPPSSNIDSMSKEEITDIIENQKDTVSFEGGEPTLSKDLLKWIKFAKEKGVKNRVLVTNAVALQSREFCKKLVESGVTLFNINFPTHLENMDAYLMGKNFLKLKENAIQNLIDLGQADKIRFTVVINSINYKILPQFITYVKTKFPQIFYIEFNFIKKLGKVEKNRYLIPRLKDVKTPLSKALLLCGKFGIKYITDGIPLCYLDGFEENAVDVSKILQDNYTFQSEKRKSEKCKECSLDVICMGPRADYLDLFGDEELVPSRKNPQKIIDYVKWHQDYAKKMNL